MKLTHRVEKNKCLVQLNGNLTFNETTNAQVYMQPLVESKEYQYLLLNLEGVNIIDSRGIGFLAGLIKDLEERGKKLSLCSLSKENLGIIESLQLHRVISIYQTENDFLHSIE